MLRQPAYCVSSIAVPPLSSRLGSSFIVDWRLRQSRPPLFVSPTTRYVTQGDRTPASGRNSVVLHDSPTFWSDGEPNGIGRFQSRGSSGLPKTVREGRPG